MRIHRLARMATRRKSPPETPPKRHPNAGLVAEGERPCPICRVAMRTAQRGDDAIDVCDDHGVWLDRFELERMAMRRAKAAGRRLQRAREESRLEGFWWGMMF